MTSLGERKLERSVHSEFSTLFFFFFKWMALWRASRTAQLSFRLWCCSGFFFLTNLSFHISNFTFTFDLYVYVLLFSLLFYCSMWHIQISHANYKTCHKFFEFIYWFMYCSFSSLSSDFLPAIYQFCMPAPDHKFALYKLFHFMYRLYHIHYTIAFHVSTHI